MAIQWGSWDSNLRAGIQATISPNKPTQSDTEVTVTWEYYVGSGQSWSDNQTADLNATGVSAWDVGYTNNLSNGGQKEIAQRKVTYGISYNSTPTKTATISIRGAYNGATPSKTLSISLPARPAAVPDRPANPSWSNRTSSGFRVDWNASSANGSSVDYYQVQISTNSGFSGASTYTPSASAYTFSGLAAGKTYYVRVRAHNSVGYSVWSFQGSTGDPWSYSTSAGGPSAPTLSLTTSNTTSASISWSGASGNGSSITGYTPRLIDNSSGSQVASASLGSSSSSHTFTGLTASRSYTAYVRVANSVGTADSNGVVFVTGSLPPTVTITNEIPSIASGGGSLVDRLNNFALRIGYAINLNTPAGEIITMPTNTASPGWVLCNGASYPISTYPKLFARIGYTYGGSVGSTFNVPNISPKSSTPSVLDFSVGFTTVSGWSISGNILRDGRLCQAYANITRTGATITTGANNGNINNEEVANPRAGWEPMSGSGWSSVGTGPMMVAALTTTSALTIAAMGIDVTYSGSGTTTAFSSGSTYSLSGSWFASADSVYQDLFSFIKT